MYKALQHSWTNNLRTWNVLSFSSSLPRFQEPNHGTPVSFILFCDEDVFSLSMLITVLILSKQLLPVQEISTAYILPALLFYHFLWYTLSHFFLTEWKVKYTSFPPPTLKLLWMFVGTDQCQSILFSEVWYCVSQCYMSYIPKVEIMMEPIQRGKADIHWSKRSPGN